jgi:hypothetical protein
MMKPLLDYELHEQCRTAIATTQPVIEPRLNIGEMVTFSDRRMPGLWVYTGDSFVRTEVSAQRRVVDYGVRPLR